MKKYLLIVLLVGVCFLNGKTKTNKELADYYLGNLSNLQSLETKTQNIIKNELDQICQNSDDKLKKLFKSKVWVDNYVTKVSFDKDGWIKESLKRGFRSGERGAEELKLAFSKPYRKYQPQLENRSIITFENNKSKYGISRKSLILEELKPSWTNLVNYYGYSKLGELGVSRSNSSIFSLIKAIYKVEFIGGYECLVESKYFGDDYAFKYHDKLKEDISVEKARFEISKVDYKTIRGKKTPKITIFLEDHEIFADLYKLDPKIKKSMDSSFTNYRKVIYNMMYDLIGEELEIKNKEQIAIKNKQRALQKKERIDLIKKLEPIVNDTRIVKALMVKKAKELSDVERGRFFNQSNKNYKHLKEKKGKNITIDFKSLFSTNIYIYENDLLYSSGYIKEGRGKVKIKKVKPNTQYQLYISTKKDNHSTDKIIAKKVVKVDSDDIFLEILVDDLKDSDHYFEELENLLNYDDGYQNFLDMYSKNKSIDGYRLSKDMTQDYYDYIIRKPLGTINKCHDKYPCVDCIKLRKQEINCLSEMFD